MEGPDVRHQRKHDIGDQKDHKGDIFDGLVGARVPITGANYVIELATLIEEIQKALRGLAPQDPVKSFVDFTTTEPISPFDGERWINTVTGTSSGTSTPVTKDYIYEWDSTALAWVETVPVEGFLVEVQAEDEYYTYTGTSWVKFATILNHPDLEDLTWSTAGHTIDTDVDFGSTNKAINLADPVNPGDAVNLNYLDNNFEPISTTGNVPKIWFVSTNGNDTTGDGTYLHPFQTFGKVLSVATTVRIFIYKDGSQTVQEDISIPAGKEVIVMGPYCDLDLAFRYVTLGDMSIFTCVTQNVTSFVRFREAGGGVANWAVVRFIGGADESTVDFPGTSLLKTTFIYENVVRTTSAHLTKIRNVAITAGFLGVAHDQAGKVYSSGIDLNSQKATNVGDPLNDPDGVNLRTLKSYVSKPGAIGEWSNLTLNNVVGDLSELIFVNQTGATTYNFRFVLRMSDGRLFEYEVRLDNYTSSAWKVIPPKIGNGTVPPQDFQFEIVRNPTPYLQVRIHRTAVSSVLSGKLMWEDLCPDLMTYPSSVLVTNDPTIPTDILSSEPIFQNPDGTNVKPVLPVDMVNQKITTLADPLDPQDAVNRRYVDNVVNRNIRVTRTLGGNVGDTVEIGYFQTSSDPQTNYNFVGFLTIWGEIFFGPSQDVQNYYFNLIGESLGGSWMTFPPWEYLGDRYEIPSGGLLGVEIDFVQMGTRRVKLRIRRVTAQAGPTDIDVSILQMGQIQTFTPTTTTGTSARPSQFQRTLWAINPDKSMYITPVGAVDFNGKDLIGLPDPTDNTGAVPLGYMTTAIGAVTTYVDTYKVAKWDLDRTIPSPISGNNTVRIGDITFDPSANGGDLLLFLEGATGAGKISKAFRITLPLDTNVATITRIMGWIVTQGSALAYLAFTYVASTKIMTLYLVNGQVGAGVDVTAHVTIVNVGNLVTFTPSTAVSNQTLTLSRYFGPYTDRTGSPNTVDMGVAKLTNVVDPVNAQDGATKNYTDTGDGTAIHKAGLNEIGAMTLKNPPTANDVLVIEDSDAVGMPKKKITIGSLPTGAVTFPKWSVTRTVPASPATNCVEIGDFTNGSFPDLAMDLFITILGTSVGPRPSVRYYRVQPRNVSWGSALNIRITPINRSDDEGSGSLGSWYYLEGTYDNSSGKLYLRLRRASDSLVAQTLYIYISDPSGQVTFNPTTGTPSFSTPTEIRSMGWEVLAEKYGYSSPYKHKFLANGGQIQGLADPALAQDGATKNYVDTHLTATAIQVGPTGGISSGPGTFGYLFENNRIQAVHLGTGANQDGFLRYQVTLPPDCDRVTSITIQTKRNGAVDSGDLTMTKEGLTDLNLNAVNILPVADVTLTAYSFTPAGTHTAGDVLLFDVRSTCDLNEYFQATNLSVKYNRKG